MAISYRQTSKPTAERLSKPQVKLHNELLKQYRVKTEEYNNLHSYLFDEDVQEETYSKEVADAIYKKVKQHNLLHSELSLLDAQIEVLSEIYWVNKNDW